MPLSTKRSTLSTFLLIEPTVRYGMYGEAHVYKRERIASSEEGSAIGGECKEKAVSTASESSPHVLP